MRNFDFPNFKINHLLGQTSFRHLGYRTCFSGSRLESLQLFKFSADKIPSLFFVAKLRAVQSNGAIEPG
jgi:hypothetical protein